VGVQRTFMGVRHTLRSPRLLAVHCRFAGCSIDRAKNDKGIAQTDSLRGRNAKSNGDDSGGIKSRVFRGIALDGLNEEVLNHAGD